LNSVKVKICGITNKSDLKSAIEAGTDAVGFVVEVKTSSRNISIEKAKKLINSVPIFVNSVVVTATNDHEKIRDICKKLYPHTIQIHGNVNLSSLLSLKRELPNMTYIKAIRADPKNAYNHLIDEIKNVDAILLDSFVKGKIGGTGVTHNWDLSLKIRQSIHPFPLILAGGLNPENVRFAIGYVQPYAVDVSSGVEIAPGKKDRKKIFNFIKNAKDL
jgi:phosphoribosylanthranilate isomerase